MYLLDLLFAGNLYFNGAITGFDGDNLFLKLFLNLFDATAFWLGRNGS